MLQSIPEEANLVAKKDGNLETVESDLSLNKIQPRSAIESLSKQKNQNQEANTNPWLRENMKGQSAKETEKKGLINFSGNKPPSFKNSRRISDV